jgi:8-oxoguanine deaminase
MPTLLAKNAEVLVTMDGKRRELKNAGLYAQDGIIKNVGPNEELPATADTVIDLTGQILLPGFVNTHHHLNQTLTRNLPAGQNNNLFPWLKAHYRVWARTTPEASRASTLIGLAELALSGCTTVFDHSYMFLSQSHPVRADEWMTAREVLELATLGGARVLGRSDIGSLEPGKCADFFSLDLHTIGYAGALHDPVAAVLFCAPQQARTTVINGKVVVSDSEIVIMDMGPVVETHNRCAFQLANEA